jgi:hypothetical protein
MHRRAAALLASTLLVLAPDARAQLPGRGTLDGLTRPRDGRIVHYASTDPASRNDDVRRIARRDAAPRGLSRRGRRAALVAHRGRLGGAGIAGELQFAVEVERPHRHGRPQAVHPRGAQADLGATRAHERFTRPTCSPLAGSTLIVVPRASSL